MADQTLDNGDVVDVRWATEDPNPKAIELHKRKNIEGVEAAIAAQGYTMADIEYEIPLEYELPPAKVQRSGESDVAGQVAGMLAYPDTDTQYSGGGTTTASDWQALQDGEGRVYYANRQTQQSTWEVPIGFTEHSAGTNAQSWPAQREWSELQDDAGRVYFYNTSTGVSQWERPPAQIHSAQSPAAPVALTGPAAWPKAEAPAWPKAESSSAAATTAGSAAKLNGPGFTRV